MEKSWWVNISYSCCFPHDLDKLKFKLCWFFSGVLRCKLDLDKYLENLVLQTWESLSVMYLPCACRHRPTV
jgi:hypothetical protein